MTDIVNLLKEIKMRPGIYIGRASITRLASFLDGYYYGVGETTPLSDPLFSGFQDWVKNRYHLNTSHNWSSIILFFECDEALAFKKFFELLDEYRAESAEL